MNKKYFIGILFSLFFLGVQAQDVIIKKNGDEIKAKVLEVTPSEIRYKKSDNPDGPTYIVPASEVFLIQYANGTNEIISALDTSSVYENNKVNPKKFFMKQRRYVSLGYGVGIYSWIDNPYESSGAIASPSGPWYFKYEYGMTEKFGLGINFTYLAYDYLTHYDQYDPNTGYYTTVTYTDHYTSYSVLVHGSLHFGNSEKVDPYLGFGLGYRHSEWEVDPNPNANPYTGYYADYNPIGFETTFGIRLKISDRIFFYSEAGVAKSVLQFGLTAKF